MSKTLLTVRCGLCAGVISQDVKSADAISKAQAAGAITVMVTNLGKRTFICSACKKAHPTASTFGITFRAGVARPNKRPVKGGSK